MSTERYWEYCQIGKDREHQKTTEKNEKQALVFSMTFARQKSGKHATTIWMPLNGRRTATDNVIHFFNYSIKCLVNKMFSHNP